MVLSASLSASRMKFTMNLYNQYRVRIAMSTERKSVPVSLPSELVERLDALVEDGVFGSRSEALRYGARLVVREEHMERIHEQPTERAHEDVKERLERKRVS